MRTTLLRGVLDLLWPPRCAVCDAWFEPPAEAWFEIDGRAVLHHRCRDRLEPATALTVRPRLDGTPVHALLADRPAWFAILHRVKYGGEATVLVPWIRALVDAVVAGGGLPPRSVVVPVPDDPARLRRRGYSPVRCIAMALARATDARLRIDLVRRRRPAPSQTGRPDDRARRRNVEGVFGVGRLAEIAVDAPVVLVDDQITSGATLAACVRALRTRGNPTAVVVLARARRAPRLLQP
jgi:predicted amidophosphoribosyltransferase